MTAILQNRHPQMKKHYLFIHMIFRSSVVLLNKTVTMENIVGDQICWRRPQKVELDLFFFNTKLDQLLSLILY